MDRVEVGDVVGFTATVLETGEITGTEALSVTKHVIECEPDAAM